MSRNNVFEKVVDFSEAESTRRERERLLSEHVHNDVVNDDDDDDMCWHEIHRCCHCFTIRGGVFLIAGLHITTLAILMAERPLGSNIFLKLSKLYIYMTNKINF